MDKLEEGSVCRERGREIVGMCDVCVCVFVYVCVFGCVCLCMYVCLGVCVCVCVVLGEELHSDPHPSIHEALDEPGVDVQVGNEAHQPDDQEGGPQHHLLPELLQDNQGREEGGRVEKREIEEEERAMRKGLNYT